MLVWWAGPIDDALARGVRSNGIIGTARVDPALFAARGLAPIGYAAFAFALGVALGTLLRRTVPGRWPSPRSSSPWCSWRSPLIRAHLTPGV